MKIAPFATEHFYAKYEFNTPYQLCNSDCETLSVAELLQLADMPLSDFGELTLGYTESQGDPTLREAITTLYTQVEADDVVVLGTPVEGIYLAARAMLEADDEVIVLSPAYDALINMFEHIVGADNVKRWEFTTDDSGWQLDVAQLSALITEKTKLVVVNFPHNPTGFLPTQAQLQSIVDIVEHEGLWLFCDEMYFGLVHSGTEPIASAADMTAGAVVLSGLSKTYGMPGLRTGWLVIRDKTMRDTILNWKFYTSICPPAPSEFLAKAALKVKDEIRSRNIAIIEQNLTLARAFFARWPERFTWIPPKAGSTALIPVHVDSVTALATRLADEAGVLIHPATTLGSDDQHMRIGLGRKGFGSALEIFEDYLSTHTLD